MTAHSRFSICANAEQKIAKKTEKRNYKNCPNCAERVEKLDDNNDIICYFCGCRWCWTCYTELGEDSLSHYERWNWLSACPAGQFETKAAWRVELYLILVTLFSPLIYLAGPLINAFGQLAEGHGNSTLVYKAVNVLLAPFIIATTLLMGLVLSAVLTIPTVIINFVRFWHIFIVESGLKFMCCSA